MLKINVILLTCALFAFCESAAVIEKIGKKCSLSDDACLQDLLRTVLQEIAEHGIPEMDIPKLDPVMIKNKQIDVSGLIIFYLKEIEAMGLKNCYPGVLKSDVEQLRTAVDLVCDVLHFEGTYKIESTPALLALIGGINIHGEGRGGIVFEKVHLTIDFALEVKKLDDGELHLLIVPDDTTYDLNVTENVTVFADDFFIGNQEISAEAVKILNENWKLLAQTFGRPSIDKAMDEVYKYIQHFLSNVPAKDLITDDLTPYVKS